MNVSNAQIAIQTQTRQQTPPRRLDAADLADLTAPAQTPGTGEAKPSAAASEVRPQRPGTLLDIRV